MPNWLTTGLKHSVSGLPLLGTPSTIKKWMLAVRPNEWKNSISRPTQSDVAELGEQMTIRLRDARSRSCNSLPRPPGWMSVGAKKMGLSGVRFHPRLEHSVAGMR